MCGLTDTLSRTTTCDEARSRGYTYVSAYIQNEPDNVALNMERIREMLTIIDTVSETKPFLDPAYSRVYK